jgi:hypothetical protein
VVSVGEGPSVHDRFYIIAVGSVDVSCEEKDSHGNGVEGKTVSTTLYQGAFFGEITLLKRVPRSMTVTTLEACVFLTLSRDNFHQFVKVAPEVRKAMERLYPNYRQPADIPLPSSLSIAAPLHLPPLSAATLAVAASHLPPLLPGNSIPSPLPLPSSSTSSSSLLSFPTYHVLPLPTAQSGHPSFSTSSSTTSSSSSSLHQSLLQPIASSSNRQHDNDNDDLSSSLDGSYDSTAGTSRRAVSLAHVSFHGQPPPSSSSSSSSSLRSPARQSFSSSPSTSTSTSPVSNTSASPTAGGSSHIRHRSDIVRTHPSPTVAKRHLPITPPHMPTSAPITPIASVGPPSGFNGGDADNTLTPLINNDASSSRVGSRNSSPLFGPSPSADASRTRSSFVVLHT